MSVAPAITSAGESLEARSERRSWRHNRTLAAGLVLLGVMLALFAAAPLLTSYSPTSQDLLHTLASPSSAHPLGTDSLGRDVWSEVLYAGRTDVPLAVAAVIAPFILGTVLGLLAGYLGSWVDAVVMRTLDIFVAFPF